MQTQQAVHKRDTGLRLVTRVEVISRLFSGEPFDDLVDMLSVDEVVHLQKFVWNKTVEIGLRLKGAAFSRKDITSRMISTPSYQRQQKCSERTYYCKATLCIHSNPDCARNKIKGQLSAMQQAVQHWIAEEVDASKN